MKSTLLPFFSVFSALLALPAFAAKELKSGEFTMVKNQVEHSSGSSRSLAKTKDPLEEKSVVDTGATSLTEVGFGDSSVLRLGSNTQFSFQSKERIIKLDKGTMLMNVPPGNGGITVDGGGVTGAVSGTTVMASRDEQGNFSFMILEGEGGGKVIGKDGVPVFLGAGQMAIVHQDGKPTKVVEVHIDAVRDVSPLYQDFPTNFNGAEKVLNTTQIQSDEIQNDIKLLSSLKDFDLTQSDPEGVALAMICGVGQNEMGASKNILLRPMDTAAGNEEQGSGSGAGAGGGSLVAVSESSSPADARQEDASPLVAASSPPSSGDGGLGGTDTAAGTEGGGEGDLGATETAAGGGGTPDTQAPIAPVNVPTTPGLTTPI